ncbi:unnamed protein product [Aureobasidium mustum]|uniref:Uncharacterized protein n=1 Tax=Aureobasidium mustum TaxID=2773714 RepID=A0A9N8K281_9PEZI|nr:unnamed protein product [Aureobasidium mustum]
MKDPASLLLLVDANSKVNTPANSHHRYQSLSGYNMTDLDSQPDSESRTVLNVNESRWQDFDHLSIVEQSAVGEQQTANLPSAETENGLPIFSDSLHRSATSMEPPSPRTVGSRISDPAAQTYPPSPPSNNSSSGFSSDIWNMSPEERALMTNSANFARGRRRRCAIQHDIPLELELPSSPSPAPSSSPASPHDLESSDDENAGVSENLSIDHDRRATPRVRLQRSFTPSERDDAGVALVPGLLRRLGRPFSGPWRGPSSPLAPVSSVAAPPVGRLSRLRRLFSRRR